MQLLNVVPKEVHATFDMSMEEIDKFIVAMSLAKINYDGESEKEKKAIEFLVKEMFPMLEEVHQKFSKGGD